MKRSKYIIYLRADIHPEACIWLYKQDIEYLAFDTGLGPHGIVRDRQVGYCFMDENDSLMFALRWA